MRSGMKSSTKWIIGSIAAAAAVTAGITIYSLNKRRRKKTTLTPQPPTVSVVVDDEKKEATPSPSLVAEATPIPHDASPKPSSAPSLSSTGSTSTVVGEGKDEAKRGGSVPSALPAQYDAKHATNQPDKYAYEQKEGNTYYWGREEAPHALSTPKRRYGSAWTAMAASKGPQLLRHGLSQEEVKEVKNASIFPFLEESEETTLSRFIKTWYRSSCAIVYRSPSGETKIIGTGSLINSGTIVTARHNFQGVPEDRLFVRFFNYEVQPTSKAGWLSVKECYLDIPVMSRTSLTNGLDAGYLQIPQITDTALAENYMAVLPIAKDFYYSSRIPPGYYVTFHFAGNHHQISVGCVPLTPSGRPGRLHDEIDLTAGPGASGAVVVKTNFTGEVFGCGISIYRLKDSGYGEPTNRLIAFSKFNRSTLPDWDNIIAPYRTNPDFRVPLEALDGSGYEFMRWREEKDSRRATDEGLDIHPDDPEYKVNDNHSNHHIIPKNDLLYLWNYLNKLDEDTESKLREEVDEKARKFKHDEEKKLHDDLDKFYPSQEDRIAPRKQGQDRIEGEVKDFKERELASRRNAEIDRQYGEFHAMAIFLCLPAVPEATADRDQYVQNVKRPFIWAWWNLFKGWQGTWRSDDPVHDGRDRSEKIKPRGFDEKVWDCIKHPTNGLYRKIQNLKTTIRDRKAEGELKTSMTALRDIWRSRTTAAKKIYAYNKDDWHYLKQKDKHDLYKVAPPPMGRRK